jgi:hypothetical protein
MVATFSRLAKREMEPCQQNWLRGRFQTITALDRRSRSVLDLIDAQPERTVIIVTEAASYRDDAIEPYVAPGTSTPLQLEDVWVPQIHALAAAAVELAKKRSLYVALDADQPSPRREHLSELLLSVDGCGVMGSSRDEDPGSILAARVDQWEAWIRAGHLGRALRDIEKLPAKLDANKPYLRIQVLYKAGHFPQALQAIRDAVIPDSKLDGSLQVKLARIAEDANASRLASEILAPAVDKLESQEDLESALATAQDTGSAELEEKVVRRLAAMFPGSRGLRKRHLGTLLAAADYAAVAAMSAEE